MDYNLAAKALNGVADHINEQRKEKQQLERQLKETQAELKLAQASVLKLAFALLHAEDGLQFYANPDNYRSLAIMPPNGPHGAFAEDTSRVPGSGYKYPMPGRRARKAWAMIKKEQR